MFRLAKLRVIGLALIFAITLALLSVRVERLGPEMAEYGNLCGPSAADPCNKPILKGGFPIAYLFDAPGVSVERQLAFGEDKLFLGSLILDIAVYFGIILVAILVVSHRRSASTHAASRART
jgi:hypothetical protein